MADNENASRLAAYKLGAHGIAVLCALSFYRTGSYQRLVGEAKYLGQTTVSKCVKEVTNALIDPAFLSEIIRFPVTRAERNDIKERFYTQHGMPGVIGCIDGSHFHIFTPNHEVEHLYFCRKQHYSLNVQMDLRRKRAEISVSLRRQRRDDQFWKRRALSPVSDIPSENSLSPEEIVEGLQSSDLATQTTSARAARRMLSQEHNPPISLMVAAGVIGPLVSALERYDCPDLQFEAAWAITNIASGTHEHTTAIVEGGAISKLVSLLTDGGIVGEQCAWALGNIAGDGPGPRDTVLAHGALPTLMPLLALNTPASQLRTAVWTYSNFCRNKNPLVNYEMVAPALPHISELLESDDVDVLGDACWALSYLTDGPNDRIEGVQTTVGLLPRLVRLLGHSAPNVRTPALRAIGNMLTGSDKQTERCIEAGCIDHICVLLRCGTPSLMKEAAWAMSNVLAGTTAQIQEALDKGALEHLLAVLLSDDIKCQKEAAWAITNLCLGGNPAQLNSLLLAGLLEPYCNLLGSPDHRAVMVVLDGLANLLQAAVKYGQSEALCLKLEEIGTLDRIEGLQDHGNEQVYKKTLHILDSYFETDTGVNPEADPNGDEYQFSATPKPRGDLQF